MHFRLGLIFLFFVVLGCAQTQKTENTSELYVQSPGAKLKTYVYGSGPKTLILVHGGPALPGYLRSLGEMLKDRFRVVEYLQRDSSQSFSNGPFTISKKAVDLKAVVESFSERGKPIVIAHSGGTLSSMEFAKTGTEAIEKLILVSASGLDPETDKEYDKNLSSRLKQIIPDWETKLSNAEKIYKDAKNSSDRHILYHQMLDLYWPAYFPDGKKSEKLKFLSANLDASKETEADYSKSSKSGLFKKNLGKIKVPVVHIHGEFDPLPWKKTSEEYKKLIKSYRMEVIPNAGHFPWLDRDASMSFIEKLENYIAQPLH